MSNYLTVSPAYGRDYKSKAMVEAAWKSGSDFVIETMGPDCGRYVNREDVAGKNVVVNIRYDKLRKIFVVKG